MAVRIRLSRIGRKNRPFYRLGAFDSRAPRNGKCIELLGWYDPLRENAEDQLKVNLERSAHWLSMGAEPTPKTAILLKRAGVTFPKTKAQKKMEQAIAAKGQSKGKEKTKAKAKGKSK